MWCHGMPTAHPCWVLDGRCTLGALAHDLLLSEQTRSFITRNLESLFYSAWAFMLLPAWAHTHNHTHTQNWSAFWFEARAEWGSRSIFAQFNTTVIEILSISGPQNMHWFFYFFFFVSGALFPPNETNFFLVARPKKNLLPIVWKRLDYLWLRKDSYTKWGFLDCVSVRACLVYCKHVCSCELHSRRKAWKWLYRYKLVYPPTVLQIRWRVKRNKTKMRWVIFDSANHLFKPVFSPTGGLQSTMYWAAETVAANAKQVVRFNKKNKQIFWMIYE